MGLGANLDQAWDIGVDAGLDLADDILGVLELFNVKLHGLGGVVGHLVQETGDGRSGGVKVGAVALERGHVNREGVGKTVDVDCGHLDLGKDCAVAAATGTTLQKGVPADF